MNPSKETKPDSFLYFEAMVSKMDDSVGQVVEVLHQKRMLNNSIIVFISDNGAPSVEIFQNWGSNYPLRGVSAVWLCSRPTVLSVFIQFGPGQKALCSCSSATNTVIWHNS